MTTTTMSSPKSEKTKNEWSVPLKCTKGNVRGEELEFYKMGVKSTKGLLALLESGNTDWSLEDNDTSSNINIYSKYIYDWSLKIYRISVSAYVIGRDLGLK